MERYWSRSRSRSLPRDYHLGVVGPKPEGLDRHGASASPFGKRSWEAGIASLPSGKWKMVEHNISVGDGLDETEDNKDEIYVSNF